MLKTKLNKIGNLIDKIKSDLSAPVLSEFLEWFYEKLDINFNKKTPDLKFKKWDIYFVNLWKNIWSELNKTRPCIVYSSKKANFWNTVVIIPLKLFKWKINNNFNLLLAKSKEFWLEKDSIADLVWIRQISKKRINKRIWRIWKISLNDIDNKILNIFWIKK